MFNFRFLKEPNHSMMSYFDVRSDNYMLRMGRINTYCNHEIEKFRINFSKRTNGDAVKCVGREVRNRNLVILLSETDVMLGEGLTSKWKPTRMLVAVVIYCCRVRKGFYQLPSVSSSNFKFESKYYFLL